MDKRQLTAIVFESNDSKGSSQIGSFGLRFNFADILGKTYYLVNKN
jgi:hypothetical protein